MEKRYITKDEFDKYNDRTKFRNENDTKYSLMKIYEYLEDKRVVGKDSEIKYPAEVFLLKTIARTRRYPEYISYVEDFIKSDYFASILKEDIYNMTCTLSCCSYVNVLLNTPMNFNQLSKEQLQLIENGIHAYFRFVGRNKEYFACISEIFKEYLFTLDGYGAIQYINDKYNKNEMGNEILRHSGMVPNSEYYYGKGISVVYLNDSHLFSIYKKIEKYMPENKEEFVSFVMNMKCLSASNFVHHFKKFANNNFTCENLNFDEEDIIINGLDVLDDELETLLKQYSSDKSNRDKVLEWKARINVSIQDDIKKRFLQRIEKKEKTEGPKVLKLENVI